MTIIDAVYGPISFDKPIDSLLRTPAIQRLREVRLSNIDSRGFPGFAGVTRYEHVVGVAWLAREMAGESDLEARSSLVFQAAGLLHDVAISAYGHLVEEASQYAGFELSHERKLQTLLRGTSSMEPGGLNTQVYLGREAGIQGWAEEYLGDSWREGLEEVSQALIGVGPIGDAISGQFDLDNVDNVVRACLHAGLDIARSLPLRIARAVDRLDDRGVVWSSEIGALVDEWLEARGVLYEHLMLDELDFVGKTMLIWSIRKWMQQGHRSYQRLWMKVDREVLAELLRSEDRHVVETVERWLLRDAWSLIGPWWVEGTRPTFQQLAELSDELEAWLRRPALCYGIKDKRSRRIRLRTADETICERGSEPTMWVFGAGVSRLSERPELIGTWLRDRLEGRLLGRVVGSPVSGPQAVLEL